MARAGEAHPAGILSKKHPKHPIVTKVVGGFDLSGATSEYLAGPDATG